MCTLYPHLQMAGNTVFGKKWQLCNMPLFRHYILNHRNLYLLGMITLVVSLPLSPFGVSLGTFIMAGNWILEGEWKSKFRRLGNNKSLIIFSSLYLIWVAGIWNTTDFTYAVHDLKIKLPLLVLPLIMGSSNTLNPKEYRLLSVFFLLALWGAVLAGLMRKYGVLIPRGTDTREMGVFVSHIRLALMTGLGILISFDLLHRTKNWLTRVFVLFTIFILVTFLTQLHTLTALFVLGLLLFLIPLYYIVKIRDKMLKYFLSVLMVTLFMIILAWVSDANRRFYTVEPVVPEELDTVTLNGNRYLNLVSSNEWENGHHTWIYVCEKELRKEWNQLSSLDYDGKDLKGNDLRFTLIRYLTSKGLRKDSAGLHQLTEKDIRAVESGIANDLYTKPFSLYSFYYKWLWELKKYRETGDASGHSLVQRIVYQKTGWQVAKKHLLTGVGTGDVQDEMNRQYLLSGINLEPEWWLRPHNQYLTILITTGIWGLLWFLAGFFYPWLTSGKFDLITLGFILLSSISMLWEDTLETQAGVYFIVFFYVLLIFATKPEYVNPEEK